MWEMANQNFGQDKKKLSPNKKLHTHKETSSNPQRSVWYFVVAVWFMIHKHKWLRAYEYKKYLFTTIIVWLIIIY